MINRKGGITLSITIIFCNIIMLGYFISLGIENNENKANYGIMVGYESYRFEAFFPDATTAVITIDTPKGYLMDDRKYILGQRIKDVISQPKK